MKYNYPLEAILKWEFSDRFTIEEILPIAKTKQEYEDKYKCTKCKKFNYEDWIEGTTIDGVCVSVLAYNPSNFGRYCQSCVEFLEDNDPDWALGLEGLDY